jgi:O-antigen ligase
MASLSIVALAAAAPLLVIVLTQRNVRVIISTLVISLVFSGYTIPEVARFAEAIRWMMLLSLALLATPIQDFSSASTTAPGRDRLPLSVRFIWFAVAVACLSAVATVPNGSAAAFGAMMLLLYGPVALTLHRFFADERQMEWFGKLMVVSAIIYVLITIPSLTSFEGGQRFYGTNNSTPQLAMTGALLFVAVVWASLFLSGWLRVLASPLIVVILLIVILSGQRTGLFSALAGALPLYIYGARVKPRLTALLTVIMLAFSWWVVGGGSTSFDFALDRVNQLDTAGRDEKWATAIDLALQEPMIGHGAGKISSFDLAPHNAYLTIAVEGGFVAVVSWIVAMFLGLRDALVDLARRHRPNGLSMLVVGWLVASMVAGLAESKLYRPTNLMAIVFLISLVMAGRLRRPTQIVGNGATGSTTTGSLRPNSLVASPASRGRGLGHGT